MVGSLHSLRALETARQCAALGARPPTIAFLTGLSGAYIRRRVYSSEHPAPRGRPPYAADFLLRATLRLQVEATLVAAKYRRLCGEGFVPAQALVSAFGHLRSTIPASSLQFDEAFHTVSLLDGIWVARERSLELSRCTHCARPHLVWLGCIEPQRCAICRIDWSRARAPTRAPPPAPVKSLPVDAEIARTRLRRQLEAAGAGLRVMAHLCDGDDDSDDGSGNGICGSDECVEPADGARPAPRRVRKPLRTRLSLSRWSSSVPLTDRVQYGVFAATYRRCNRLGLSRAQSIVQAVQRVRQACRDHPRAVPFDRCVEVAALLHGGWGVKGAQLEIHECPSCGAQFLHSVADPRGPSCPFCDLARRQGPGRRARASAFAA